MTMLNDIDLSRTDLNLLVLFEAVLQERHVGRAADRLSLTPSAVSHGLGRLRRLLNDPLFLRTPKGVVPTTRAAELAGPIAEILARVRSIVAAAVPFDAATSTRRFMLGAPDGVSAVVLPSLLAELEARALDVAVVPLDEVPARFAAWILYEADFIVVMRPGHPFADDPSLDSYCRMRHVVVSLARDDRGLVDDALAQQGLARRVALAVPNFLFALAAVAETDLLAALPRRFVALHAPRFELASAEAPLPLPRFRIRAVVTEAALADAGVAWLLETLVRVSQAT
jgi:DNA-binding transcriptional LysR family regulator